MSITNGSASTRTIRSQASLTGTHTEYWVISQNDLFHTEVEYFPHSQTSGEVDVPLILY